MKGPFATPEARDQAWESGATFPDMLVRPEGEQTMFYPLRWYWTPEEGWRARILEPSDLSGPTATDARFTDQEKDPTAVYREAQVQAAAARPRSCRATGHGPAGGPGEHHQRLPERTSR